MIESIVTEKNLSERTWINQPRSMSSTGFQAIATIDNELFIYEEFFLNYSFSDPA